MGRRRQSKKGKKKQSKKKKEYVENNQHTNIPPSTLTSRVSDICSLLLTKVKVLSYLMVHMIFNLSITVILVPFLVVFTIIQTIFNAIIYIKHHREKPESPADMNANAAILYRHYSELFAYYSKYWLSPYTAHKKAYRIIDSDKTLSPETKQPFNMRKYSIYPSKFTWINTYPIISNPYCFLHEQYYNNDSVYDGMVAVSLLLLLLGVFSPLPLPRVAVFVLIMWVILVAVTRLTTLQAGKKNPLKQAVITAMEAAFELHREFLRKKLSPQQVTDKMNQLKRGGYFGWMKSKSFMVAGGKKSLFDFVVEHIRSSNSNFDTSKIDTNLWNNALKIAFAVKVKSGGKRPIGDITIGASLANKKKAAEQKLNEEMGLADLIPDFGNFMKACEACRSGDKDTIVPGMYNCFSDLAGQMTADLIAIQVVSQCLDLLVE